MGPQHDLRTPRRNQKAPSALPTDTHSNCHTIVIRCGHITGEFAACAAIVIGELNGKIAAIHATVLPGLAAAAVDSPPIPNCPSVIGSAIICSSRWVEACAPRIRYAAPTSRYDITK